MRARVGRSRVSSQRRRGSHHRGEVLSNNQFHSTYISCLICMRNCPRKNSAGFDISRSPSGAMPFAVLSAHEHEAWLSGDPCVDHRAARETAERQHAELTKDVLMAGQAKGDLGREARLS